MRKVVKQDFRVTVYPRSRTDFGWASISNHDSPAEKEKYEKKAADEILREINRHVDNISNAHVEYETITYCRDGWTSDAEGNSLNRWPECCFEDQKEFYQEYEDESDEWFFEHGMDDPGYLDEFRAGEHL